MGFTDWLRRLTGSGRARTAPRPSAEPVPAVPRAPDEPTTFIKLDPPSTGNIAKFESMTRDWPEVTQVELITGAVDYLIRVVTPDMHAYDDFLRNKLLAQGIVSDVQSRIVLSTAKESSILPVPEGP